MSDDRPAETLRDAVLLLARDPGWVPGLSQLVIDEVEAEVPELLADEELRFAMRNSNEELLRTFIEMLRGSVSPQTAKPPSASVEYTREVVRRGVGVDSLLRGYHAAQAAFFKDFARRVRSEPALSTDPAATIEEAAQWSFGFVAALNREVVGFIGAMGSRRATETRRERLEAAGLSEHDLDRISAPVGLDLGAESSEETALSILAEVIAARHDRQGGRLADAAGRIHQVAA